MKDWKRTLTIGTVWGFVYFAWLYFFMYRNWEFNIFKLGHYQYVWSEFVKGWQISALSEWIFVLTLLAALPVFAAVWRWLLKFQWKKLAAKAWSETKVAIKGKPKEASPQKLKDLKPKTSKNTRPRALETGITRPIPKQEELKVPVAANEKSPYASESPLGGGSARPSMDAAASRSASLGAGGMDMSSSFGAFGMGTGSSFGNFGVGGNGDIGGGMSRPSFGGTGGAMPSFMDDDDIANMPLDEIKLPERKSLDEDIPELFKTAGYTLIQSVILNGLPVDYVAISAERILLAVVDNEKGDWLADEERFNGEEPLWFSESSHRVSPLFTLMEKSKPFADQLATADVSIPVQPMLIEQGGSIINADDMVSVWKDLGVLVSRTGVGGPDELATTAATIPPATTATLETVETVKRLLE